MTNTFVKSSTRGRVLGSAIMLSALFLAGCGGSDESSTDTSAPTSSTPSSEVTTTTAATTPAARTVVIRYADGKVIEPTSRVNVNRNERVELRVESDIPEEVHFHGYDLKANVAPGTPAVIAFTANIPGVFEVEFENSSKELASIGVNG